MRAPLSTTEARAFELSMPERYRTMFGASDASEHAAIVARRRDSVAHVEVWRPLAKGGALLCVVADDRPGLLSFISASLVVSDIDVDSAQIYTRIVPEGGHREAVDLLWARRSAGASRPVLTADVERVAKVLRSLVTGQTTLEQVVRQARPARPAPPGASTRVTFDENRRCGAGCAHRRDLRPPGSLARHRPSAFPCTCPDCGFRGDDPKRTGRRSLHHRRVRWDAHSGRAPWRRADGGSRRHRGVGTRTAVASGTDVSPFPSSSAARRGR